MAVNQSVETQKISVPKPLFLIIGYARFRRHMSDIQTRIDKLVSTFVSDLTDLARAQARETLLASLDGSIGGRKARGGFSTRGGGKRTSVELERISDTIIDWITKHPGTRIEEMNKELGTSTRDLALPMRKLVADGVLTTKGARRATKYFVSGKKRRN